MPRSAAQPSGQSREGVPQASREKQRARRSRTQAAEERRSAILAAALEEFTARGYEGARLDDVAKRAGIAKGTIYLYFADKETLFQALVRSMVHPVLGTLEKLPDADIPERVLVDKFEPIDVAEMARAHVAILCGRAA